MVFDKPWRGGLKSAEYCQLTKLDSLNILFLNIISTWVLLILFPKVYWQRGLNCKKLK
jgi:hypothetical protein